MGKGRPGTLSSAGWERMAAVSSGATAADSLAGGRGGVRENSSGPRRTAVSVFDGSGRTSPPGLAAGRTTLAAGGVIGAADSGAFGESSSGQGAETRGDEADRDVGSSGGSPVISAGDGSACAVSSRTTGGSEAVGGFVAAGADWSSARGTASCGQKNPVSSGADSVCSAARANTGLGTG